MLLRALDEEGDWTFGKGKNNYKSGTAAVVQNVDTRLKEFLGDCFFALTNGIDWLNLLGAKDQTALNLSIAKTILTSREIISILQLTVTLDPETRNFFAQYEANSVYSPIAATTEFNPENV